MKIVNTDLTLPENCIIRLSDVNDISYEYFKLNTSTSDCTECDDIPNNQDLIYSINIYSCNNDKNIQNDFILTCNLMKILQGDYEDEYTYFPPTKTNYLKDVIEKQEQTLNKLYELYDLLANKNKLFHFVY